MEKGYKNYKWIPETLALLLAAVILLGWIGQKQGYHQDEMLVYELANAEFNPWIVSTQPQGRLAKYVENEIRGESLSETLGNLADTIRDVLQNRGSSKLLTYTADVYDEPVWIDRETFADYITVDGEDAFNYLSVYFNVKDDNHPPLHFMVLHTISSIFQGQATPLMGCSINLACVLGVMLLIMMICHRILGMWGLEPLGRMAGIALALLYALSVGGRDTVLLIRMYAMVTFFCVALLAVHLNKLFSAEFGTADFTQKNGLLIWITMLGFWTQYFFLFYCLALAAVTAVILWKSGRKGELRRYIRSMVTAAVIGVAVFPFAISDVFSSGRGVEALENLSQGLSGYGTRLAAFGGILLTDLGVVGRVVLPIALVCCGLLVLFRKKTAGSGSTQDKETCGREICLWCVLLIPAAVYFLLAARMAPYLVDRYIMPLFPLVLLAAGLGAIRMLCLALGGRANSVGQSFLTDTRRMRTGQLLAAAVLVLIQFLEMATGTSEYTYSGYADQLEIAEEYAENACLCLYDGVTYYENLPEFTRYAETLLLTEDELENRTDTASLTEREMLVVLVKPGVDAEAVDTVLTERYGLRRLKTLYAEEDGDTVYLYENTSKE